MTPYQLIRPLLYQLDPEVAHHVTMCLLNMAAKVGYARKEVNNPILLFGNVRAYNRVGCCAGIDKNGDYIDALAALNFGFIEIGTVTPYDQPGNSKPRIQRDVAGGNVYNSMGFPNKGVEYAVKRIIASTTSVPIGLNIGKNAKTHNNVAYKDYTHCMSHCYQHVDYITINISSPNTESLRELQTPENMLELLTILKNEQALLEGMHSKYTPLVVKLAPDLEGTFQEYAEVLNEVKIDGIIATNTMKDRRGGLSGEALTQPAYDFHAQLTDLVDCDIVSSGGIMTPTDAARRVALGSKAVQIFTGMIYTGPQLITDINLELLKWNQTSL